MAEDRTQQAIDNAASSICFAAEMVKNACFSALGHYEAPNVIYRPRLFKDGNKWCALYGKNLQDGVAGFGDSPAKAMWDFDKEWNTDIAEIK